MLVQVVREGLQLIAATALYGVAGRFGDLLSLARNVVPLFDLDAPQAIYIQYERDAETGEMRMLPWSFVPVVDHRTPSPGTVAEVIAKGS